MTFANGKAFNFHQLEHKQQMYVNHTYLFLAETINILCFYGLCACGLICYLWIFYFRSAHAPSTSPLP
jgi:hypothetical protein